MKSKSGFTSLCVFAVMFGAVAAIGLYHTYAHVGGWLQTRSWQPVMIEVLDTRLISSGRKSHRVQAVYRYQVDGKTFRSTRVGYTDHADAIGSWHEDAFRKLEDARLGGRSMPAWFNPRDPGEAIIDRSLRWGLMLFAIPLTAIFLSGSILMVRMSIKNWRESSGV